MHGCRVLSSLLYLSVSLVPRRSTSPIGSRLKTTSFRKGIGGTLNRVLCPAHNVLDTSTSGPMIARSDLPVCKAVHGYTHWTRSCQIP